MLAEKWWFIYHGLGFEVKQKSPTKRSKTTTFSPSFTRRVFRPSKHLPKVCEPSNDWVNPNSYSTGLPSPCAPSAGFLWWWLACHNCFFWANRFFGKFLVASSTGFLWEVGEPSLWEVGFPPLGGWLNRDIWLTSTFIVDSDHLVDINRFYWKVDKVWHT